MDDGVYIGKVPEDIVVGNNGVDDVTGNQDISHTTVENVKNSDNRITVVVDLAVVDPTNRVFTNVLIHFFGFLLPGSNLPPGVTAAYFDQSHSNKFKFSFTSLLTLLQG